LLLICSSFSKTSLFGLCFVFNVYPTLDSFATRYGLGGGNLRVFEHFFDDYQSHIAHKSIRIHFHEFVLGVCRIYPLGMNHTRIGG